MNSKVGLSAISLIISVLTLGSCSKSTWSLDPAGVSMILGKNSPSVTYSVTYNGNGNTGGTVPADANSYLTGQSVTVLNNTGALTRTGYYFAGWNTVADGSGTIRAPGSTFTMGAASVVLYAQWSTVPVYTVAYNGNGSTGGSPPTDANLYLTGQSAAVLGNTGLLVRTNYDFSGWNTRADGLGVNYAPGSTLNMGSTDVTLFAVWTPFFAGGDGSAINPYQVSMASQLNHVRDDLGAHYIQTADIDLNVAPFNTGTGWEPIGNGTSHFVGTYDGSGYTITNLYINRPAENNIGLFGYTDGAELSNLVLDGAIITGYDNVGSLVGYNSSASMTTPSSVGNPLIGNCSTSGFAVSGHNNVGGLVGYNWGSGSSAYASVIENCFAIGSVNASGTDTGGLVGINVYYGTISKCYAQINVTGVTFTGGMTGYTSYGGVIYNSYATGSVIGNTGVGGLSGLTETNTGTVTNCYSACLVSGSADYGGLNGQGGTALISSYYDTDLCGLTDSDRGTPTTTGNMILLATFSGWDFGSTWQINGGVSYPYLQWQGGMNIPYP